MKRRNNLLVIGIDEYDHIQNLSNAQRDANEVGDTLTNLYTFEKEDTIYLYNQKATCVNIQSTLDSYSEKLGKEDNLVIYFAGHGYYNAKRKTGYLVPVDGRMDETTSNQPVNFISFTDLMSFINAIDCHQILLISDCCFSGSIFREKHRNAAFDSITPTLLEEFAQKPCRQALTSGLVEKVSDGGYAERNGPFAKALIDVLKNNNNKIININKIGHAVQLKVKELKGSQTPWYGALQIIGDEADFGGEFVFFKREITSDLVVTPVIQNKHFIKTSTISKLDIFLADKTSFFQQVTPEKFLDNWDRNTLIERLFDLQMIYNEKVVKKEPPSFSVKRLTILNALPSIIAEPIRRLFTPLPQDVKFKIPEGKWLKAMVDSTLEFVIIVLVIFWIKNNKKEVGKSKNICQKVNNIICRGWGFLSYLEKTDLNEEICNDFGFELFFKEILLERALVFDAIKQSGKEDDFLLWKENRKHVECQTFLLISLLAPLFFEYSLTFTPKTEIDVNYDGEIIYLHEFIEMENILGGVAVAKKNLDYALPPRSILLINKKNNDYINLYPFYINLVAEKDSDSLTRVFKLKKFLEYTGELYYSSETTFGETDECVSDIRSINQITKILDSLRK